MYFVLKTYFVRKFDIILEKRSAAIPPVSHSPHLGNSSFSYIRCVGIRNMPYFVKTTKASKLRDCQIKMLP